MMTGDPPYVRITSTNLTGTAVFPNSAKIDATNGLNAWSNTTYYPPRNRPIKVHEDIPSIEIMDPKGPGSKVGTITREELVKYLEERRIREENELVRSLWERYQVALKLVRNSDDDDQGNQP